ncbi:MAG: acylphosphatase [Mariprofundaceae bacterium]
MNADIVWQRARIAGRVQEVAFRHYTKQTAESLGIRGWVRNLPDGRVEALIGGPAEAVEAMRRWLAHGPRWARVDHIDFSDAAPEPEPADFRILPTPAPATPGDAHA